MISLAFTLDLFLKAIEFIVFLSVILSWVGAARSVSRSMPRLDMGNPIVRFIESVSWTILHPIRRFLAPYQRDYPMDFSPMVAIIGIEIIRMVLIPLVPF